VLRRRLPPERGVVSMEHMIKLRFGGYRATKAHLLAQ
jgi:hypothetical protein